MWIMDRKALDRRRPDHACRMELDELHVDQRATGPQGQGVPVSGVLPGVRGHLEGPADATGGQHDCWGTEEHKLAALSPVPDGTGDGLAVLEQAADRALHVDVDGQRVS